MQRVDKELRAAISGRVKQAMEAAGVKTAELSRRVAGRSDSEFKRIRKHLDNVRHGSVTLQEEIAASLAPHLGTTADWLLHGSGRAPQSSASGPTTPAGAPKTGQKEALSTLMTEQDKSAAELATALETDPEASKELRRKITAALLGEEVLPNDLCDRIAGLFGENAASLGLYSDRAKKAVRGNGRRGPQKPGRKTGRKTGRQKGKRKAVAEETVAELPDGRKIVRRKGRYYLREVVVTEQKIDAHTVIDLLAENN